MARLTSLLALIFVATFLGACAPSFVRSPVPIESMTSETPPPLAALPGVEGVRYWGEIAPPNLTEMVVEAERQREAAGLPKRITLLALSGGADNGAYGAGLINGWTVRGDRPEFIVVTGVSTGALSAPFVFLGPAYDDVLKLVYSGYAPSKIYTVRNLFSMRSNVSVADPTPLSNLIADFVDEEVMAEIAREHKRGRRLLVQTTHLDAQRPVIWDIGAIAVSGAPNAVEVVQKVLLASSSIPGVFPPVIFEVNIDDQIRDELHADGGIISQSTVLAEWQGTYQGIQLGVPPTMDLYLLRNGRIRPEPQQLDYTIFSLADRSISTMIKVGGVYEMQITYDASQLNKSNTYQATWIGEDFDAPHPVPFEQDYMKALFDYGYEKILSGKAWSNKPPLHGIY